MPLSGVKSLLTQGRFLQADREAQRLISSGDLSATDLAEAYVQMSIAKLNLQDYFAGAKVAERALALPEASRDTLGMAYFMAGAHYVEIGDAHLTIQNNQHFLSYLDASPRCKRQEPTAHFNVAIAYRQKREYAFAIGHYELASSIYSETERIQRAMSCYREIAWCYLVQGEANLAYPLLQRIEAWVAVTENVPFRAKVIVDKALYCYTTSNFAQALAHCEEIFAPGREDISGDQLTEACWIAGECALVSGQVHEATIFANLTIEHALKAQWPFMMNRGSDLRRRILEARPQSETAS